MCVVEERKMKINEVQCMTKANCYHTVIATNNNGRNAPGKDVGGFRKMRCSGQAGHDSNHL